MPINQIVNQSGALPNMVVTTTAGYNNAVNALQNAINILTVGALNPAQWALLNQYYLLGAGNNFIPPFIVQDLQHTLNGLLNNNIRLEIIFFNVVTPGVNNTIQLARAQFINPNQIIRYLIHEASHLYAATVDVPGQRGYINNNGAYRGVVAAHEVVDNADTLACLAVGLNGIPLV